MFLSMVIYEITEHYIRRMRVDCGKKLKAACTYKSSVRLSGLDNGLPQKMWTLRLLSELALRTTGVSPWVKASGFSFRVEMV
jgi:hypothetical protein